MGTKLLAVRPDRTNYLSCYEVSVAPSFEAAKLLLVRAEEAGAPFETLDLPVYDEKAFCAFLDWLEATGRRLPFSVFGCRSTRQFIRFRDEARRRGFHFND